MIDVFLNRMDPHEKRPMDSSRSVERNLRDAAYKYRTHEHSTENMRARVMHVTANDFGKAQNNSITLGLDSG